MSQADWLLLVSNYNKIAEVMLVSDRTEPSRVLRSDSLEGLDVTPNVPFERDICLTL